MARLAAAGPSPLHHHQRLPTRPTPTFVPAPNPSFPRRREPHLPQQTPSTNPPNPTVVPAFAGTQGRCAARWRLRPPPFPPPLTGIPAPYSRVIPAKAGIQRGTGRGATPPPPKDASPTPPTPRRRGLSRMARPAAARPSPLHHHQHLPSHPTPPSFPRRREPHLPQPTPSTNPPHRRSRFRGNPGQVRGEVASPSPAISATPNRHSRAHPRVIPAKAGTQRGTGRGATPPPPKDATPPPQHPVVGAFREWPVPPQRDPHPSITASAYRPTQPHRRSRESGNPGQVRGRGASPPPAVPTPPSTPPVRVGAP